MGHGKDRITNRRGTTLVELTVAMAILAAVFATLLPLLAGIRNSVDSRWAGLELIQNARVLNEQLGRCLAGAKRIVTISDSKSDDGYLEFEAVGGTTYRCALGVGGWVEYGPVGNVQPLAGPAEYLRFVCSDGRDDALPSTDPNAACLVAWEVRFRHPGDAMMRKTITGACYLRAGAHQALGYTMRAERGLRVTDNRWRSSNHQSSIIHHPYTGFRAAGRGARRGAPGGDRDGASAGQRGGDPACAEPCPQCGSLGAG